MITYEAGNASTLATHLTDMLAERDDIAASIAVPIAANTLEEEVQLLLAGQELEEETVLRKSQGTLRS